MKITIDLHESLPLAAQELSGEKGLCELLRKALQDVIQCEICQRLAELGGTMPELINIPRRRATQTMRALP